MRIEKLLEAIEESIGSLENEIESRGIDELLSDRFKLLAVRSLQISFQALIDLSSHLV